MLLMKLKKSFLNFFQPDFMVRRILLFLFVFLFCSISYAGDTLFFKTVGDQNDNFGKDIIHCQDNGFLAVGSTYVSEDKKSDMYLVKFDSIFEIEWSFAYGGSNIDGAESVVELPDGSFIIAGYSNSFGNTGYDVYVVSVNSTGSFLWEKTYGGADWDFAHDLILTQDNHLLVCGETFSYGQGNSDAYLLKLNTQGDTIFTRTDGLSGKDAAYSLIESADFSVYITGETNTLGNDSTNILWWKLNALHENELITSFGGIREDIGYDLVQTLDNQFVISGSTGSLSNRADANQYLVKINALGQVDWQLEGGNAASDNKDDVYYSAAQNSLGLFLAGGFTKTYGYYGTRDISISCFDGNGNFRRGNNIGNEKEEWIEKIIAVNDRFVLVGSIASYTNGNMDVFIGYGIDDMLEDEIFFYEESILDTFVVSVPSLSMIEPTNARIYPNPASEYFFIANSDQNLSEVRVFNLYGQEVLFEKINDTSPISISHLSAGTYLVQIQNNSTLNQQILLKMD